MRAREGQQGWARDTFPAFRGSNRAEKLFKNMVSCTVENRSGKL